KSQALQSAWTMILQQQERSKVAKLTFVSHSQHRAEAFQVNIRNAHLMMRRHAELAHLIERGFRLFLRDREHRRLRRFGAPIYQIHDIALMLSDNCSMWIRDKVAHICGMPVITPRQSAGPIHSLLHYGPLASRTHDKAVQIELKSVGNRIVIDSRRKPAGTR